MRRQWLFFFLSLTLFFSSLPFAWADGDEASSVVDPKALARQQKAEQDSLKHWMKEARQNTNDKAKPNFNRARAAMRKALASTYGKDNAEVLHQAATTEYVSFQNERNKPANGGKMDEKVIYAATAAGFRYYSQAYQLYHHPEHSNQLVTVKTPSRKDLQLMRTNAYELFRVTQGFRATAGYYSQQKNWKSAHEFFDLALQSIDSEILADYAADNSEMRADFERFRTDSLRSQLTYSRAVTAVMMGDHELSIRELSAARTCGVETNGVYQQLCNEYLAVGDSAGYIATLTEGVTAVPGEAWFPERLLNIHLAHADYESALSAIDNVIATTPGNASNIELKARLLDELGRDDEAEPIYLEAISLDSTLFISYMNLGSICYNRAVIRENALVEQRQFDAIYDEAVPLYELALPYYFKAFELDTKREDDRIPEAIRTILFKRFQDARCTNSHELIRLYNKVSRAYGWSTL